MAPLSPRMVQVLDRIGALMCAQDNHQDLKVCVCVSVCFCVCARLCVLVCVCVSWGKDWGTYILFNSILIRQSATQIWSPGQGVFVEVNAIQCFGAFVFIIIRHLRI